MPGFLKKECGCAILSPNWKKVGITMKAERILPKFIITATGTCENGGLADAVSEKGKYLGTGFVSRESKIRLRLISRNANDRFDEAFWRRRIQYAWDYLKTVMGSDISCCRVIFGVADGFPGLTVDRFSDILVTQTLSVGMERIKPMLFPLLAQVLREDGQDIRGIYERNDVAIRALEGMEQNKGWFPLPGETPPAQTVTEIGRKPAFSWISSTTAWRWPGWRRGSMSWTALLTPAPLL